MTEPSKHPIQRSVDTVIARVERAARKQGIKPETLARKATNNGRLIANLRSRAAALARDLERLQAALKREPKQ